MPSDIFIKTATSWTAGKAKSIFIKTASSTWSAAKSVWLFFDAGWTRVWPLSGVYPTRNPFVSTTSSSSELSDSTVLRVGTTYRGNRGTWNPNGYTISSYQYKWLPYTYQDPGDNSTNYDPLMETLSGTTNDFLIPGTNYDKGWIVFFVTAKASGGTPYDGSAESFRYYVVRQKPRISVGTTPSFNITSPKIGNTISYSSSWDITDAYKPEAARTTIVWYKNSTATTTGGTPVQTGGYSYVVQSTDSGSYIYAVETSFNSGSDYDLGSTVGISATAITSSAVTAAIAAPTISSITVSSIGGPVSVSFAGGSGPFYQIFWWGTATAPTGTTNADASGSASPLTDNTGPTSTATQYMYVRSVTTQSDTGVANATTISPWSDGVQFNMTSASALTPTFGTNTSTANGFTGSVTNYDSAYNWNTPSNLSFTLTNGTWTWGTASGATRPFTVTGLSASQSSTATVTTTRADYASGSNSTTGTASALPQYTVTWGANGGTGGGSTGPFNSGVAHTAPSPGTREGFTFANYRYPASGGTDPVFVLSGGSYTPTGNTTFGAQWTANVRATGAMRRVTMPVSFTNSSQSIWVGTNGYVSTTIDPASSIGTTWPPAGGVVVGPAVADMKQVSLFTLSDASNYYVRWRGHGFSEAATTVTLDYLMKFYWNSTTVDVYFITNSTTASLSSSSIYYGGTSYALWDNSTLISGMTIPAGLVENTTLAAETDDDRTAIAATKPITPIIPTITMGANTSITSSSGTINWSSTNQASFSSNGTFSGSGTTATSISKTGLSGSTTYTGTVTVTSSTGHTASANYSLTTTSSVSIPANTSQPTLSGGLAVGTTLTFGVGSWSGSPISYALRLYRGTAGVITSETLAKNAGNVTSSTYVITQADYDSGQRYFRAFATATNAAGTSNSGTFTPGQEVGPVTSSSSTPATAPGIPGTPTNGWTSGLTYPFSWAGASVGTVAGGGAATISSYQIRIYRASDSAGTGSALYNTYTSTGSGLTYSFTAPDGLYYAASVSATNSAGLTSTSYSGISAYK